MLLAASRYLTMRPVINSSPVGATVGDGEGVELLELEAVGVGAGVSVIAGDGVADGSAATADPIENGISVEATSEPTTRRLRHEGAVVRFGVCTNRLLGR